MPVPTYYCDYCDIQFKNTRANRKQHERDNQHQQAKDRWYNSSKLEEQQQQQQQQLLNAPPSQGFPKPLCNNFVNTGFCCYDDPCMYFHPSVNNIQQPTISTPITPGSGVQDNGGVSSGILPPSLQPPPEGGYPPLPFVDWG